jgi:hypothetical protein
MRGTRGQIAGGGEHTAREAGRRRRAVREAEERETHEGQITGACAGTCHA